MRSTVAAPWHPSSRPQSKYGRLGATFHACVGLLAIGLLSAVMIGPWIVEASLPSDVGNDRSVGKATEATARMIPGREALLAGYIGAPFYYPSDVHMTRPDATDLKLKRVGWDGDALYFPIDGGVRSVEWWNSFGVMIDFVHNKAVSRLGRGAHGRKLSHPVVEEVDAEGTLNGTPAPKRVKMTDVFERLEFTHGHNVLLFTPLVRLGAITPRVRPYFGFGFGFALPHVEVWFPGEAKDKRTNEYQFAGPAAQLIAGLEVRSGKFSYFVEYKFIYAWISAALTGDESWKNFNMPGDMLRQFGRWWTGGEPQYGRISTVLGAHQVVAGGGYWLNLTKPRPAP